MSEVVDTAEAPGQDAAPTPGGVGFTAGADMRRRNLITGVILLLIIALFIGINMARSFSGKGPSHEGKSRRELLRRQVY